MSAPSSVLELAAGLDEWICEYEKSQALAAPKKKERNENLFVPEYGNNRTEALLPRRAYESFAFTMALAT